MDAEPAGIDLVDGDAGLVVLPTVADGEQLAVRGELRSVGRGVREPQLVDALAGRTVPQDDNALVLVPFLVRGVEEALPGRGGDAAAVGGDHRRRPRAVVELVSPEAGDGVGRQRVL